MSPRDLATYSTHGALPLPAPWTEYRDPETGFAVYRHPDGTETLCRCTCGTPFVPTTKRQMTCGEKICLWRLREHSKGRVEIKRARFTRWWTNPVNRRNHIACTLRARKRRYLADRISAFLAEGPRLVRDLYAVGLDIPVEVERALIALWYVARVRLEGDVIHPAPGHPARKVLRDPPARFAVPEILRAPTDAPALPTPKRRHPRVHPVPATPAIVEYQPPDPCERPAPSIGPWLPGLAVELQLETLRLEQGGWVRARLALRDARSLHAAVTQALGVPHDRKRPDFALIPTNASRSAWGLYVADEAVLARALDREHRVVLAGRAGRIRFGTRARLRAPTVDSGRYRLRIDTITPLVVRTHRADGREVTRLEPKAPTLISALLTVARRLGLAIAPEDLLVEQVEHDGEVVTLPIDKISDGEIRGWLGSLVITCNAPARWLFEVAARVGLGGRVAFGFGRVVIREAMDEETPEALHRPVTMRERYEELWPLLTPRQRDILAIFAEAQRAHRPRPAHGNGVEGPFFVTPHAVLRYGERLEPDLHYEAALRGCVDISRNAQRIGMTDPDPETKAPREIWEGVARTGQRVRFIVGNDPSPWIEARLPQMITVLLPEEAPAALEGPDPTGLDWTILDRAARQYLEQVVPVSGVEQARRCIRLELLHARRVYAQGTEERWRGPPPSATTYHVQLDEDGDRVVTGVGG